jgi:hypothetical protein
LFTEKGLRAYDVCTISVVRWLVNWRMSFCSRRRDSGHMMFVRFPLFVGVLFHEMDLETLIGLSIRKLGNRDTRTRPIIVR